MKHMTIFVNDSTNIEENTIDIDKDQVQMLLQFQLSQLRWIIIFFVICAMLQNIHIDGWNNLFIVKYFEKINVLLEKVEQQMDRLIDKHSIQSLAQLDAS